jgi:hypothetical protein
MPNLNILLRRKKMPNPTNNNKGKKMGKYQQDSGTNYHKEHASHVPDYGGNSMEPSAETISNQMDNK